MYFCAMPGCERATPTNGGFCSDACRAKYEEMLAKDRKDVAGLIARESLSRRRGPLQEYQARCPRCGILKAPHAELLWYDHETVRTLVQQHRNANHPDHPERIVVEGRFERTEHATRTPAEHAGFVAELEALTKAAQAMSPEEQADLVRAWVRAALRELKDITPMQEPTERLACLLTSVLLVMSKGERD